MDVGKTVLTTTETIKANQKEFQKFTAYNNLFIVMASAVCVGIVTKDAITDIMNDAVLPIIIFFGKKTLSYFLYRKALEKTSSYPILNLFIQRFGKLIWILLIWLLVMYVTWILFKKLIKFDLVSGKAELIEDITKYVTSQEKQYVINYQEAPTFSISKYII